MFASLRTTLLCSLLAAAACTSSPAPVTGSAGVVRQLGAKPTSDLAGTWALMDSNGVKSELVLNADGTLELQDFSFGEEPPATTSGSWGVADNQLNLIYDADDPTTYHRIAWTYLADSAHLGVALLGASGNVRPVGTWSGELADEVVDASNNAVSGTSTSVTYVLSADGTAKSLSLVMSPEAPATWADPSGTYVVAADGSISLKFQDGNVSEDVKLLPCAGGYANPVFVHP